LIFSEISPVEIACFSRIFSMEDARMKGKNNQTFRLLFRGEKVALKIIFKILLNGD